jgi:preprotein translocase subunit YajC
MTDIFLQAAPGGIFGGNSQFMIILVAMFAVMYFFMIRPQNKKQNEQKKFIEDLAKGQKVVTMGGIHGKIVQINDDASTILLEVAEGTKIKVDKSVISMEYSNFANQSAAEPKK